MTDWKERVEQEAIRRATEENTKKALLEAQQNLEINLGELRLKLFDYLYIPQKLHEINRSIWQGIGEMGTRKGRWGNRVVLGVHMRPQEAYGTRHHAIREPITKKRFGKYVRYIPETYSIGGVSGGGYNRKEIGWYYETVGYKITGVGFASPIKLPILSFEYESKVDEESAVITVRDDLVKFTEPNLKHGYSIWNVRSDDNKALAITFRVQDFDPTLLGGIVDNILIQSCAIRLPYSSWLIQDKVENDNFIRDIQSRIGQIEYIK